MTPAPKPTPQEYAKTCHGGLHIPNPEDRDILEARIMDAIEVSIDQLAQEKDAGINRFKEGMPPHERISFEQMAQELLRLQTQLQEKEANLTIVKGYLLEAKASLRLVVGALEDIAECEDFAHEQGCSMCHSIVNNVLSSVNISSEVKRIEGMERVVEAARSLDDGNAGFCSGWADLDKRKLALHDSLTDLKNLLKRLNQSTGRKSDEA